MVHVTNTQYAYVDGESFWQREFALLPHRSKISNKLIWLKFAYSKSTVHGYYTEAVTTTKWRTEQEHMIEILKG